MLVNLPDPQVWEFEAGWLGGVSQALALLARQLGADVGVSPGVNCRGMFATPSRPPCPTGEDGRREER